MNKPALLLENISKKFGSGEGQITVLKEINLQIDAGEVVAIVGSSGCGKSTLLHIAGLLDSPDSGFVGVSDWQPHSLKNSYKIRRKDIGFVYQNHNLLRDFSARENIAMPLIIAGMSPASAVKEADILLAKLGLADKGKNMPGELSGGQQQRVAIARSIIHRPKLVLADEPTGNLDAHNSQKVFNMLADICSKNGTALLMVTHNPELASQAKRRYKLEYFLKELT